jgi:hypothetical protein
VVPGQPGLRLGVLRMEAVSTITRRGAETIGPGDQLQEVEELFGRRHVELAPPLFSVTMYQ